MKAWIAVQFRRASTWKFVPLVVAVGVAAPVTAGYALAGDVPHKVVVAPRAEVDFELPRGLKIDRELVSERTKSSTTYRLTNGQNITAVSPGAMNAPTSGGLKPVDTTLRSDGETLATEATGYDLSLPRLLGSGPIAVEDGQDRLSFSLAGARNAAVTANGAEATYSEVLPNVDLEYLAGTGRLKETLILNQRGGRNSFRFSLNLSAGLVPKLDESGAISLERGGKQRMWIAPPDLEDAAGARSRKVDYRLAKTGDGWDLIVTADRGWLDDAKREYPVRLDPYVFSDTPQDCYLDQVAPNTSLCADPDIWVGNNDHGHSALFKFPIDGMVPKGARVEGAFMKTFVKSRTASASKSLGLYRTTQDWTGSATWNKRDGTNNWTNAGGSYDGAQAYAVKQMETNAGNNFWPVTSLVQGWVDGRFANQGLLIKDRDGTTPVDNSFIHASSEDPDPNKRPTLLILWDHRPGVERQFGFEEQTLSDRMGVKVNLGNGNLVTESSDASIAGTGLDLAIGRSHNAMTDNYNPTTGGYDVRVGHGWQLTTGMGIHLRETDGGRLLRGPTGSRHFFDRQRDGSYKSPTGIDATLTDDGSGWRLKYTKTLQTWAFNSDGDLTSQTDRNNNQISFTYSSPGKLSKITDTQGRDTTLAYDAGNRVSSITDPASRVYQYGYNGADQLTSYTDPDSKTTEYTYLAGTNKIDTIKDPRGKYTKFTYDSEKRLTELRRGFNPADASYVARWQFAYSAPTAPCAVTGAISKTVVTGPRGHDTTYCFDLELRPIKVVDAQGKIQSSEYTANSDVDKFTNGTSVTDPTWSTDGNNNLASSKAPAGEENSNTYGNSSFPTFPTESTNAQGNSLAYAYTAGGNVSTTTNGTSPTQIQAKLEYNGDSGGSCADTSTRAGTVKCAVDGEGRKTIYHYDGQGNLTRSQPEAPLGSTYYTYDSVSRLKTVKEPRGTTTTYTYDALDRVTRAQLDNIGGSRIDYTYDDNGNQLSRVSSALGDISNFTYDSLNRKTQDALPGSQSADYEYDAGSNLTKLTDGGGAVSYAYDSLDRLSSLTEPGSLQTTFGYDARDNRTSIALPNGVTESWTFDASDKATKVEAKKGTTTHTSFTYVYDITGSPAKNTGKRQSVTDKAGNKTTYGYDTLERLTSAVERNSSNAIVDNRAYTYDKASNRKTSTINGATRTFAYNNANQLCWFASGTPAASCSSPPSGSTTFTYDAAGNELTGNNGRTNTYNVANQMAAHKPTPTGSQNNYTYLADTQTLRATINSDRVQNDILGVGRIGSTYWTRTPDGTRLSQRAGSSKHYYLRDGQGSAVALADTAGAVTRTYAYDPFGAMRSTTGTTSNPWQFNGEHAEPGGSFYKIGARYYDPAIGRWSQSDPVDNQNDIAEANRYAYAAADPVNRADPSGNGSCQTGGAIQPALCSLENTLFGRSSGKAKEGIDAVSPRAARCLRNATYGAPFDIANNIFYAIKDAVNGEYGGSVRRALKSGKNFRVGPAACVVGFFGF